MKNVRKKIFEKSGNLHVRLQCNIDELDAKNHTLTLKIHKQTDITRVYFGLKNWFSESLQLLPVPAEGPEGKPVQRLWLIAPGLSSLHPAALRDPNGSQRFQEAFSSVNV